MCQIFIQIQKAVFDLSCWGACFPFLTSWPSPMTFQLKTGPRNFVFSGFQHTINWLLNSNSQNPQRWTSLKKDYKQTDRHSAVIKLLPLLKTNTYIDMNTVIKYTILYVLESRNNMNKVFWWSMINFGHYNPGTYSLPPPTLLAFREFSSWLFFFSEKS